MTLLQWSRVLQIVCCINVSAMRMFKANEILKSS